MTPKSAVKYFPMIFKVLAHFLINRPDTENYNNHFLYVDSTFFKSKVVFSNVYPIITYKPLDIYELQSLCNKLKAGFPSSVYLLQSC